MGVIYKLKDEVIEYILRQKRENPRISCRKLAIIIEENFHVLVSKSSINAVIKDAQLSSPVGRTPADLSKSKKFSIPKEKKTQLFGSPPVSPEQITQGPKIQKDKPNERLQPTKIQIDRQPRSIPPFSEEAKVQITGNKEDVSLSVNTPPVFLEFEQKSETVKLKGDVIDPLNDFEQEKRFEVNDMTPFFMRLALRDFFPQVLLEDFFKRHTSLSKRDMRIVDILFCLSPNIWEDPSIALDPHNRWFWELDGLDDVPEKEEVESIIRFLNFEKVSSFDYFLELTYFCSMVQHVKIVLENKKEIIVDGRHRFIGMPNGFFPCPIERAAEETAGFINGLDTLILHCPSGKNILGDYESLLHMCAGIAENSIDKIILVGASNQLLLDFTHIPNISRQFILTTWMSKEQFEDVFQCSLRFTQDQKMLRAGEELMYVDLSNKLSKVHVESGEKENIWAVGFYHEDSELVEICLTNMQHKSINLMELENKLLQFPKVPLMEANGSEKNLPFDMEDKLITISDGMRFFLQVIGNHMDIVLKAILGEGESFLSGCAIEGFVIFDKSKSRIKLKSKNKQKKLQKKVEWSVLSLCNRKAYGANKILLTN